MDSFLFFFFSFIALKAWNPDNCGMGEKQNCPRTEPEGGARWLWIESQDWKLAVASGLHEMSGEVGKGWDLKGIEPRDLQTLQGEGGDNIRAAWI